MPPDPYPNVDEFGAGATTCQGTMTGCAVCSTADVIARWGITIPRTGAGAPDMRTLGAIMGAKHRAAAPGVRHGLSLSGQCTGGTNWCAYCAYLQLKAEGVPVAYGRLTWAQIVAHLELRRPVILPGAYGRLPVVGRASYSSTIPAKGRSDSAFTGAHMMVAWGVASRDAHGAPTSFYVSDPDFGSPARPVVPPHSVISATALKAYWSAYGWPVTYALSAPPAQGAPRLPYGAVKYGTPLRFRATVAANERSSPRIAAHNVNSNSPVKKGTTIRVDRYTKAGTNVGGSSTWYGTDDGNEWFHSSVVARVGAATGTEAIQ